MKSWRQKKDGFTLLEILTAGVLLAVTGSLIAASFLAAGRYTQPQPPTASNAAQTSLESLYPSVTATWDNPPSFLIVGTGKSPPTSPQTINGVSYTTTYDVANVTGKEYRKVTLKTTW